MTSQEYTQWLKGFLDAVDGYNITKRQFDSIREKLKEVNDNVGTTIGTPGTPYWGGFGTTTPYTIPLTGTITTSSYPSGSTLTYTTGNSTGTYTIPAGTITPTTAYVNQIDEEDEKLLID